MKVIVIVIVIDGQVIVIVIPLPRIKVIVIVIVIQEIRSNSNCNCNRFNVIDPISARYAGISLELSRRALCSRRLQTRARTHYIEVLPDESTLILAYPQPTLILDV